MPRNSCCSSVFTPKKRISACVFLLLLVSVTVVVFFSTTYRLNREQIMEENIVNLQTHLTFLESQFRGRQEEILTLQSKVIAGRGTNNSFQLNNEMPNFAPEIIVILKNCSGTQAAAGVYTKDLPQLRTAFLFQILPHLMNDSNSLKPAYHMRSSKNFFDIVIGIPSVKRDKENYLMNTLSSLISGMSDAEAENTLIVVFIGETDLGYVINTARQIEITHPKQVNQGTIEVISPSASYYPDLESLPDTLGDSHKRVKWRTKQNLDTIYLMAYAQSRGALYLMLEDDVTARKNFIRDIKEFTATTSVVNPNWFFIEYSNVGGIGKLFRSSDLIPLTAYVQLFYNNMPIDWLLESYLADRVCTIDKSSKACAEQKLKIRPKFKTSLFQHVGVYSSLKGKIQKVKDTKHHWTAPPYFPHKNPPLRIANTTMNEQTDHGLKRAYEGKTFFWGFKPVKGDLVEFWFDQPTNIERYTFRSGNVDHPLDRFYDSTVEVLPQSQAATGNFTVVGSFDEFGIAEGDLKMGPIEAIRIKVNKDAHYWVILSEIEIQVKEIES